MAGKFPTCSCLQCKKCKRRLADQEPSRKAKRLEYNRKWKKDNYERHKSRDAEWRHGLPRGSYSKMISDQDGLCKCCGDIPDEWHVDHDHETMEIRGMLCRSCNLGLGFFKDSTVRLRKAIDYLCP